MSENEPKIEKTETNYPEKWKDILQKHAEIIEKKLPESVSLENFLSLEEGKMAMEILRRAGEEIPVCEVEIIPNHKKLSYSFGANGFNCEVLLSDDSGEELKWETAGKTEVAPSCMMSNIKNHKTEKQYHGGDAEILSWLKEKITWIGNELIEEK
ncbi:MAG: hypothetical protein WC878_03925 [Candidatus Paceibacterota bacterium]|jgi:hypothetical protein